MRLLIVDDEQQIREGLKRFIEKQHIGISRVITAKNAQKGLEIAKKYKLDIIISDIVMPGIDGIQFVTEICNLGKNTRIIMISGHDEVAYLKSAIKLNVVDYILKPIDIAELLKVLKKVILEIKEEQMRSREKELMRRKLEESIPLLKDKFLCSLVTGDLDIQYIRDKLRFLGLSSFLHAGYIVLNFNIEVIQQRKENLNNHYNTGCDIFHIKDFIEKTLSENKEFVFHKSEYEILAFYLNDGQECKKEIYDLCERIYEHVLSAYKAQITIGVGRMVHDILDIPLSYESSVEAVNQRFILGKGQIIFYSDIHFENEWSFTISKQLQKRLMRHIYARDMAEIKGITQTIFKPLYAMSGISTTAMNSIRLKLVELVVKVIIDTNIQKNQMNLQKVQWNELLELQTLRDIESWCVQKFEMICKSLDAMMDKKSAKIIRTVKDMIRDNYNKPLNVQLISYELNISPNYLSALFKNETGINLTEYLTTVRMEKAKALIRNADLKIHEISLMVGYEDHNYFSKIFRKACGISPSAYRDMV